MENPLDDDTRELLRKSHSASQSLVYIIDDLLSLTRSHDGSFPLLEFGFDMRSALQEAFRPLESHASRKGLEFVLFVDSQLPQFVRGDFQRFQQAVVHVVSNAIRYTATGKVQIEVKLVEKNSSHCLILILVEDSGTGISEDNLDEIFQDLEQIPSEDIDIPRPTTIGSSSRSSTPVGKPRLGLGLATVARFTRLRGGLLKVKSQRQKGTTLSLLLPFPLSSEASHPFQLPTPPVDSGPNTSTSGTQGARSVSKVTGSDYVKGFFEPPVELPAKPNSPPTSPGPQQTDTFPDISQQPMVVIVADDNNINLQILQRRLERMGHQVYLSGDGQQCYRRRGWLSTLPMAATVNTQYLMPPQYPSILGLILWAILGLAVLSAIVFSCVDGKERRSGRRKRPSAWTGRAYDIGNAGGHHGGGKSGDGGGGSDGGYLDGGGG